MLWGLLPHSIAPSLAYTEPVLTAFAAWSSYAVLTGRWLWAGTLAALAGMSRPNGLAVAAAVLATAACEVWRRRGRVSHRLWTGAALAPVGWAAMRCGWADARAIRSAAISRCSGCGARASTSAPVHCASYGIC